MDLILPTKNQVKSFQWKQKLYLPNENLINNLKQGENTKILKELAKHILWFHWPIHPNFKSIYQKEFCKYLNQLWINSSNILQIWKSLFEKYWFMKPEDANNINNHERINTLKVYKMLSKDYFDVHEWQPIFVFKHWSQYFVLDWHHRKAYFEECTKEWCLTKNDKLPYVIVNLDSNHLYVDKHWLFEQENWWIHYPINSQNWVLPTKEEILNYIINQREPEFIKLTRFHIKIWNIELPIYDFRLIYMASMQIQKNI